CGEGNCEHDLQHDYCVGTFRARNRAWGRAHAGRDFSVFDGNARAWLAALLCDGSRAWIFHWTELGAADNQLDLLADVVLQRFVGAIHVLAEGRAEDRFSSAAVSLVAIGVGHGGCRHARTRDRTLGSADGVYHDLPWRGANRIPTRSGKDVWIAVSG